MTKKTIALLLALLLVFAFAACGGEKEPAPANLTPLKIGASDVPHAEILEHIKPALAEQGIDLQISIMTDYVIPNTSVQDGELDVNYFQHQPYLDWFNVEYKSDLVTVAGIHFEPLAIFAGKTKSLADLAEGAKIAVPNDTTNEARALLLLQANGILKLADGAGLTATTKDIVENKLNISFLEMESAALPSVLADVDLAIINGNYALSAGLSITDALALEDAKTDAATTYTNIVVVKKGNETNEAVGKLVAALKTDDVKNFINDKYQGAVIPMF